MADVALNPNDEAVRPLLDWVEAEIGRAQMEFERQDITMDRVQFLRGRLSVLRDVRGMSSARRAVTVDGEATGLLRRD